jgi:hypothetical protein
VQIVAGMLEELVGEHVVLRMGSNGVTHQAILANAGPTQFPFAFAVIISLAGTVNWLELASDWEPKDPAIALLLAASGRAARPDELTGPSGRSTRRAGPAGASR